MEDLEKRNIPYLYEKLKLKYVKDTCPSCGHKIKVGTYTPDFQIGNLVIESKGLFTKEDRDKMVKVKRDNPTLDICMLFMSNNKLTKSSKYRYLDWAEKFGFKASVGLVPEEWISHDVKNLSNM
jgi:hypothetical protein